MFERIYDMDFFFLSNRIEPRVWRFEYRTGRTRFSIVRALVLLILLVYLINENFSERQSIGMALGAFGFWWLMDKRIETTEILEIAKGAIPNPLRPQVGRRLLIVGILFALFMSTLSTPPVTGIYLLCSVAIMTCMIVATYVMSCNPKPVDYVPPQKPNRPY